MIFIFPCAGFSSNSAGKYMIMADSLRVADRLDSALLLYERAVYESEDNATRTEALLAKAFCQEIKKDMSGAYKTCNRINYFGLNDSLHYMSRYRAALYGYLSKDFEGCVSQMLLAEQFLPKELTIHSKPLYALGLNELRRWNEAQQQMALWVDYQYRQDSLTRDSLRSRLDMLYKTKHHPKYRDPERAMLWSSFLPGTGQLYSGYLFDGAFTALMVLSGLGIAAYGILVANYYVTGAILGYGVFQRFYVAGQRRSEFLARRRNYKAKREYNEKLEGFILGLSS